MSSNGKIKVSQLTVYPVKSAMGINMQKSAIGVHGLHLDRRWTVYDAASGMFVAQRADRAGIGVKSMCLIEPRLRDGRLFLYAPGMPPISVPIYSTGVSEVEVQIWDDNVIAQDQGDAVARWLTKFLSIERTGNYRLARFSDTVTRKTELGNGQVMFADGYPILVVSEASLQHLNSKLEDRVDMNRFRPNIVLKGCLPHEEDSLMHLVIGEVELISAKLCARCVTINTDQDTGLRGLEPLRTLATYRKDTASSKVMFGNNYVVLGSGEIKLNSKAVVLQQEM